MGRIAGLVLLVVFVAGCGGNGGGKPQDPVNASVGAEGGAVSLVTADGTRVTIDFPPGAVDEATSVSLIPAVPRGGSWLALEISPAGLVADMPLAVTVERPPGATASAAAGLAFEAESGEGRILLPTTIADGGRKLSTQVRFLGLPGVGPTEAARASRSSHASPMDPDYWRRFFLVAGAFPLADVVPALRQLLDMLVRENRYEDAVSLLAGMVMLIQRRGEEDWDAQVLPFMNEAHGIACTALGQRVQALADTPMVQSPRQIVAHAKPIAMWAEIEQKTNVDNQPCAPAQPAMAGGNFAWADTIGQKAQAAREAYDGMGRRAFLKAECDATPPERQPAECAALAAQVGTADAPTTAEVRVATGSTQLTFEDIRLVRAVELGASPSQAIPAAAQVVRTTLAEPEADVARIEAYAYCRKNDDQAELGRLISVVPLDLREPLQQDGQHCASHIELESPAGTSVGELGGGAAPGGALIEEGVNVLRDQPLRLQGNLRALHCPQPQRVEMDTVVVTAVGLRTTEVARLSAAGSDNLLVSPLELNVSSLLAQAGLDPMTATEIVLELRRDGPGCDGLFGAGPVTLYTIWVTVCAPPPRCVSTCGCFDGPCAIYYNCGVCGGSSWCKDLDNDGRYQCEPCGPPPTRDTCPAWDYQWYDWDCGWMGWCGPSDWLTGLPDDIMDCDPDPDDVFLCMYRPTPWQGGSCYP